MKLFASAFLLAVAIATLLVSGCSSYDGGGSSFSQQDLELQRRNIDRTRGF